MELALSLLARPALDALITGESEFDELPDVMARLATPPGDTLCHRIRLLCRGSYRMYSVTVRDHFMIAHSFQGEVFGPAQRLHGATYVVDVEFRRAELDDDGIVVDIGRATEVLPTMLAELNYRNLDEEPAFTDGTRRPSFSRVVIFDADRGGDRRRGELGDGGARRRAACA